jgi:hypothetical protein
MNLMRKIGCALIVASCVASNAGAMQQQPAAPQQVANAAQNVQQQQPAPAAAAGQQQGQAAPAQQNIQQQVQPNPVNRCSCAEISKKCKTHLSATFQKGKTSCAATVEKIKALKKLACEGDKKVTLTLGTLAMGLSCFLPSLITSTSVTLLPAGISAAAYEFPKFRTMLKTHWHTLIPFGAYLLASSLYEYFCGGVSSSKKIALAFSVLAAVICLGKYLYRDCAFINDHPKTVHIGLLAFLAVICLLRSFEILPDSAFAACAIPTAGIASSLYFFKTRNAQTEKKPSKEKTDPSKKTV